MSTMICLKRIIFFLFREWYSYHFPELVKIINDNYLYAKTAKFIGNRKEFTEERVEELEEVVMDSGKARAIYDASRSSMGKCRISSIFVYCYEYINSHFYQIKLSWMKKKRLLRIIWILDCKPIYVNDAAVTWFVQREPTNQKACYKSD